MKTSKPLYHRRRFPAEIISHCVWLYFRFALSYRDVEEIMAERGVVVSYETIRDWSLQFGGTYAKRLRSRSKQPGDHWHLDEVYLSINGKLQYLWRAVDQDGEVLDILVQPRRNKQAAKAQRFLSSFGVIASFFRPSRHLLSAANYREIMRDRFAQWSAVTASDFVFQ